MDYIIVWRNSHRGAHIDVDSSDFIETYSSYESAKEAADNIISQEGGKSPWYYDYAIYQRTNN
jgi:hypothetical protein